jgi:hypothetical protein
METKKQTALRWMIEQLSYHFRSVNIKNTVIFEDAEAMMNEQIEYAYKAGYNDCAWDRSCDSEKYFTSTFE